MNSVVTVSLVCLGLISAKLMFTAANDVPTDNEDVGIRPGHSEWPVVWTTYRKVKSLEEDIADLKAHGVGLISWRARNVEAARSALEVARRTGMKYHISLHDITERARSVSEAGHDPVPALMIGGVYNGKAIDRHLFSFTPEKHEIVIEPPVYNKGFAYTRGSGGTGRPKDTEKIAHYFPDIGAPARAEVVVPLRRFDGEQHLRILPATVTEASADASLEIDSVTPDMPESSETSDRKLYRLTFDLSGLGDALLDHVGLAVYWEYAGTDQYWMFGRGNVSAWAASTQAALRIEAQKALNPWIEANDGTFPHDVVLAVRYGDECFYVTSHLNGLAVNYPLWEYSQSSIDAFYNHAGHVEYPRTWGFPEIYGSDAYAWWLYTLHEGCAGLCGIVREEISKNAPGLSLFRNQTRAGVFNLPNDHDGSGQELLTRNVDIVHLDPYPASGSGYGANIPRDMSYCGGLARRYDRPLVPWMQAHTYGGPGGLQDVSPEHVERMAEEQRSQGVDAVMWLGYGFTFPEVRPDSWEQAGLFHKRLADSPPPKPKAQLAVVRSYRTWALSSRWEDQVRNPADWLLQQLLEVWAVKYGKPYDVFEIPPELGQEERDSLEAALKRYPFVVSTEPREGAWVIGKDTEGTAVQRHATQEVRRHFEEELKSRGWLKD
ncbi:hypothetical protein ACFL6S_28805 [Candidatus Poribacteria bacterium]